MASGPSHETNVDLRDRFPTQKETGAQDESADSNAATHETPTMPIAISAALITYQMTA